MPLTPRRSARVRAGSVAQLAATAACLALLAACGRRDDARPGSAADAGTAEADGPPPGGYPFPPGMPPPTVCAVDDDCVVVTNIPADRCCDSPGGYLARSRAWLRWVHDQRRHVCAAAKCPRLPLPGPEPVGCVREARCLRGSCDNACNTADAGGRPPGAWPAPPPH